MNTSDDLMLAAAIQTAVVSVPGVAAVYRSSSMPSRALEAGERLLGMGDDVPLVRLERGEGGLRVEAAIGVCASGRAPDTARTVHAVIRALLVERGLPDADIRLTVVHLDDSAPM